MTGCDDLEDAIDRLALRVPVVAVKQGRSGSVVRQGSQRWHVPAIPVAAGDTIGAGASFTAGSLKGLLAERPGGTEACRDAEFRKAFLAQHISKA